MMKYIKLFLLLSLTFLTINISFVGIHYAVEKFSSASVIEKKYTQAFESGHFFIEQYPFKDFGRYSLKNVNGIDQYSECVNALMSIYRNQEDPLLNAIIPAYPSFQDEQYCFSLKKLLVDRTEIEHAKLNTKARLWFGTRAFTILMLSKFEIAQLYPLIKQINYFGFTLLLALAFSHSIHLGFMVLPITAVGIFGSGIPYYGGIANALPFAVALYLGIGMALIRRLGYDRLTPYYAVVAGSVMAFFYLTDGSLILSLSLMILATYFYSNDELKGVSGLGEVVSVGALFVVGFFMSFVFKQIAAGMITDFSTVWSQFTDMIAYRLSTQGGPDWNHWQSFFGQIEAYDLAVQWNPLLYKMILILGTSSWGLALVVFALNILVYRQIEDICALAVFLSIAFVVFLRYFLMVNHSFEHWFIVARYIFILFSVGMSAAVYSTNQLLKYREIRRTRH